MPSHSHELNVTSVRFGAGLGGAAGLVAILLFNCSNPYELHDTKASDWSVNVALGENWTSVLNGLKNYEFFETMAKISGNIRKATPHSITNVRNGMSYLYSVYDVALMSGPKLISLDIPSAGVGVEFSVNYMEGEITVGDLVTENWAG